MVAAATAMQVGDWKQCQEYMFSIKVDMIGYFSGCVTDINRHGIFSLMLMM